MSRARVLLHIGLPKTGTSFLQRTMTANERAQEPAGVCVPRQSREEVFAAVLSLTERSQAWGRSERAGQKAWREIVRDARRGATTVISSETLCIASPEQIARVMADLDGTEVHVVVTVRDPGRQLPAEWQEGVKHGRRISFPRFLDAVLADGPLEGRPAVVRQRYWAAQDPVAILQRWGAGLDPRRLHVVTCPPSGAPREELWRRFARVLGVADLEIRLPEAEVNTSLGQVQTDLLRQLNKRVDRREDPRTYGAVVKRLYAGTILRAQRGERVVLPPAYDDRLAVLSRGWVAALGEAGYDVVGDLDDLVPVPSGRTEQAVTDRMVLDAALDATADLLDEITRLRAELDGLRGGERR